MERDAFPALADPKHTALTRAAHAGLGIAVVLQLASSQFMDPDNGGNSAFAAHQYVGLAAFGFVLLFWIVILVRRYGTETGLLFPWFNGDRLAAVWADTKAHLADALRFKLPPYERQSPLAGAIHGLGLAIITLMAASGTLYFFVNSGDPDAGGLVAVAMSVHFAMANLVWAYLILHAATAVLYHFASDLSLRDMWSVDGTSNRKS